MSNAFSWGLQPIFCPQLLMSTIQAATVSARVRQFYSTCVVKYVHSFVHLCVHLMIRSFIQ